MATSGHSDIVDIDYDEIRLRTAKAVKIFDGQRETWLPLSEIEISEKTIAMPEWLAIEKGLV